MNLNRTGGCRYAQEEFEHGRKLLLDRLERYRPKLVIFTFKTTAEAFLGAFPGNGFIGKRLAHSEVFVMPGPYESAVTSAATMGTLTSWFAARKA